jgi:hypothetical protein
MISPETVKAVLFLPGLFYTVIIYIFVLWSIMTQNLGSQWLTATP